MPLPDIAAPEGDNHEHITVIAIKGQPTFQDSPAESKAWEQCQYIGEK